MEDFERHQINEYLILRCVSCGKFGAEDWSHDCGSGDWDLFIAPCYVIFKLRQKLREDLGFV